MYNTNFNCGDLLEYSSKLPTNIKNKLNRKFPEFARCKNNVRAIYVRMADTEYCEVIPCTIKTNSTAAQCFDTELSGQRHIILACSKRLYKIKAKYFVLSQVYPLIDPEGSVNYLMTKRKQAKVQRRIERIMNAEHESELHRQYRNSVISNDRQEMQRITSILGYTPIERGLSSSNNRAEYNVKNPKPYQGGRFSPK
jgi:hypothetical protein